MDDRGTSSSPPSRARDLLDQLGWIDVLAGVVQRGTPPEEVDRVVERHADLGLPRHYFAKEAPRIQVRIPGFTILRTPVTLAAWQVFARDTGRDAVAGEPNNPVDGRAWTEVQAFCAWFGTTTGQSVRLSSEDEWERAARGDEPREYPWGDAFDPTCANLAEAGLGRPSAVGSFPKGASPFGLLDMAGNVDEWTSTLYAPYPGAPPDVPAVESWARDPHITRGGSWRPHRDLARCARRHGLYGAELGAGFRLVRG